MDEPLVSAERDEVQLSLVEAAISRGLDECRPAAADDISRAIQAAYRLIERDESAELKMRDLLTEAGLSTQQFYKYFASKDDFITALLEDGGQQLLGYLEHQVAKKTVPRDRIEACLNGLLAQAEDLPVAARTRPFLIYRARLHQRYPNLRRRLTPGIRDLLAREIAAGRPAGDRASAEADADCVLYLTGAVIEARILEGVASRRRGRRTAPLAFCFRALQL